MLLLLCTCSSSGVLLAALTRQCALAHSVIEDVHLQKCPARLSTGVGEVYCCTARPHPGGAYVLLEQLDHCRVVACLQLPMPEDVRAELLSPADELAASVSFTCALSDQSMP